MIHSLSLQCTINLQRCLHSTKDVCIDPKLNKLIWWPIFRFVYWWHVSFRFSCLRPSLHPFPVRHACKGHFHVRCIPDTFAGLYPVAHAIRLFCRSYALSNASKCKVWVLLLCPIESDGAPNARVWSLALHSTPSSMFTSEPP